MNKFQNESTNDRLIRLLAGLLVAALALFFASGTIQVVLSVVAVILLFTAATGFCALYKLFGYSTKK